MKFSHMPLWRNRADDSDEVLAAKIKVINFDERALTVKIESYKMSRIEWTGDIFDIIGDPVADNYLVIHNRGLCFMRPEEFERKYVLVSGENNVN